MSFVDGFISCAISDEGHSDVVRVNFAHHEKMMYSIDSDKVEGLRVFQNSREIEVNANPMGGKTLVQLSVEPNNWFGMVYRRANFVSQDKGIWKYLDDWHITNETISMLMLPRNAVIESLNTKNLAKEIHDFDNHLVLTEYCFGGDLQVKMKYALDSKRYASLKYPALTRSNFLYAGYNPEASEIFGIPDSGSGDFRTFISTLSRSLDWLGRVVTLYEALHYLKLL